MDRTYIEDAETIKKSVTELISFCIKKDNLKLRQDNMDEYKQVCMRVHTEFHQKYPTLFFSIVENPTSFPIYRLNEMLELKKKIETNDTNQDKASIILGEKYYGEFVKDTVKELDKSINK